MTRIRASYSRSGSALRAILLWHPRGPRGGLWVVLGLLVAAQFAVAQESAELAVVLAPGSSAEEERPFIASAGQGPETNSVAVGPGTASAPTVKLIGPGTSIEHAFRVTVHLRSSEEWYRARRLGLDAIRIGSDQYELPLEVLLGLRRQGIAFDIVGGTTRLMVLPRALEQTSPQASMAPAQPGVSGFPTLATGSIELYSGQIDVYIEDNTGQGQYYRMRSQVAPAGAEVTDLRYRLRTRPWWSRRRGAAGSQAASVEQQPVDRDHGDRAQEHLGADADDLGDARVDAGAGEGTSAGRRRRAASRPRAGV